MTLIQHVKTGGTWETDRGLVALKRRTGWRSFAAVKGVPRETYGMSWRRGATYRCRWRIANSGSRRAPEVGYGAALRLQSGLHAEAVRRRNGRTEKRSGSLSDHRAGGMDVGAGEIGKLEASLIGKAT